MRPPPIIAIPAAPPSRMRGIGITRPDGPLDGVEDPFRNSVMEAAFESVDSNDWSPQTVSSVFRNE